MMLKTNPRNYCRCTAAALLLLLVSMAADASGVTINWTLIGNPGNAADPTTGVGAVGDSYFIGTYEVTNNQYLEFLNSKDPTGANTLGLYDNRMSTFPAGITLTPLNAAGGKYTVVSGSENRPVNYVSWYDTIRFANWLNNGQGNGDTETGAYMLLGSTPEPSNGASITRNAGANVFLPNDNEWYKAAYYNPVSNSYFQYPTRGDTAPAAEAPPGGINSANYDLSVNNLTDVGAYNSTVSPYGTFDQAGNVSELNEALIFGSARRQRGGGFNTNVNWLHSSFEVGALPTGGTQGTGFRVASIPEPRTAVLAMFVGGMMWWFRKRIKILRAI